MAGHGSLSLQVSASSGDVVSVRTPQNALAGWFMQAGRDEVKNGKNLPESRRFSG